MTRRESAHQRDLGALARDQAADARDLAMTQRDAAYEHHNDPRAITGAEIVLRAADQRKRAARDRVQAAENRVLAAQDRRSAADDRLQAARDRLQALADREAFAPALVIAETDALTGVHTRAAGLTNLDSELDRCRRPGRSGCSRAARPPSEWISQRRRVSRDPEASRPRAPLARASGVSRRTTSGCTLSP